MRARGLLRSVGWCAAGRDHVRAAGSFWARGARVHACLEGRLSHGTRLLRTTGRAPLPASSPVRFLASARSESATLDGPYNIRLHQTAPCGLGLYSGRAESLVVRYCGHPGSGVRNRFLERLVSIWSSQSDRNSSRPERTHGAAGEPEPLYRQDRKNFRSFLIGVVSALGFSTWRLAPSRRSRRLRRRGALRRFDLGRGRRRRNCVGLLRASGSSGSGRPWLRSPWPSRSAARSWRLGCHHRRESDACADPDVGGPPAIDRVAPLWG